MKIKSQRTTTSASAENALPVRSSKWPTPDYDYAPSRKIRKTGQRGRPRKIPAASKVKYIFTFFEERAKGKEL